MGLAPEPGAVREAAEQDARTETAQQILTILYDGQRFDLAWHDVPVSERVTVRKETGLPYSAFIESAAVADDVLMIDEDSFNVIWWLARRANGEPRLTWVTAMSEWDKNKIEEMKVSGIDDIDPEVADDPQS